MSNVNRIRATRHFDRLRAGEEVVVDITEEYWANQISAGNVEVLDAPVEDFPAGPAVEAAADELELAFLLTDDERIPEPDPED